MRSSGASISLRRSLHPRHPRRFQQTMGASGGSGRQIRDIVEVERELSLVLAEALGCRVPQARQTVEFEVPTAWRRVRDLKKRLRSEHVT